MTDLLDEVLGPTPPEAYALLAREGRDELEVLVGRVLDVELLGDIPLRAGPDAPEILALVPYRQVRERGYEAHDDGAPLRCLIVERREAVPLDEATRRLPAEPVLARQLGFDVSDQEYAEIVRRVIETEIGRGEGANFVIRRDFKADAGAPPREVAPRLLRTLLERESGAYWTFAVVTPGIAMVGASPERHVSVIDGTVTMNPISGTYRHPAAGPDPAAFLSFLDDVKEVEELFMVVDEELKMMSAVCTHGGFIHGPYLKQMSRLTHTEYLLRGGTDLDVRAVLRETMFAPTVTGSPMENACAVIARHEPSGRGYYSGVLALLSPARPAQGAAGYDLDAPILIRTAHLGDDGLLSVPAGATLVRHSKPESEVAETASKASGVLAALGVIPGLGRAAADPVILADDPAVEQALRARNAALSPFWLNPQQPEPAAALVGRRALIVDAEDRFTTMLAHMLRHLGMAVEVVRWDAAGFDPGAGAPQYDLLVAGPGPGDPLAVEEPRIAAMHALVRARREAGLPLLAVCLSHQILSQQLGLPIEPLPTPRQGLPLPIPLYGGEYVIGFYNTFTARLRPHAAEPAAAGAAADAATVFPTGVEAAPLPTDVEAASLPPGVEAATDPATGDVFSLRGPGLASIQGHVESILSRDGLAALRLLAEAALA